ncbi:hypothetical protein BsWGS_17384 [Bradybaena similaris]
MRDFNFMTSVLPGHHHVPSQSPILIISSISHAFAQICTTHVFKSSFSHKVAQSTELCCIHVTISRHFPTLCISQCPNILAHCDVFLRISFSHHKITFYFPLIPVCASDQPRLCWTVTVSQPAVVLDCDCLTARGCAGL